MSRLDNDLQTRIVDRIRAITFKDARDAFVNMLHSAGPIDRDLFSRPWVAARIKRSETFVKRNWTRDPYETGDKERSGRPEILSQESKDIIIESSKRKKFSSMVLKMLLEERRGKDITDRTIRNYQHKLGLKVFHEITKSRLTPQHREDRLWFANYLSEWDEEDFLNIAAADEFYIYICRKPNHQNDVIWARSVDEIPDDERFREVVAHPVCLGLFLCFTAKTVLCVVKENGDSWNGDTFRAILVDHVIPFLRDPTSVMDPATITFLHDRASCMSALKTQDLLKSNGVDFFGNQEWPGNSCDLNPTENLGSIVKERVEHLMLAEPAENRMNTDVFKKHVMSAVEEIKEDTDLLDHLLRSMKKRLEAVIRADGGHTKY